MENIRLIKDIRQGCYSNDPIERRNSGGGFLMPAGALYDYFPEQIQSTGKPYPAHYACGTHIIYERDIDWSMFIEASKYDELMDKIKHELEKR